MLIDGQAVSLYEFRNAITTPTRRIYCDITLDMLLTALEETDDPKLIASFARHLANRADELSLDPLIKKYRDDLPIYAKKALWQAIAASTRFDEEPAPQPEELMALVERVLAQPNLPSQLLVEVYQACSTQDLIDRCGEEEDSRKMGVLDKVIEERFQSPASK